MRVKGMRAGQFQRQQGVSLVVTVIILAFLGMLFVIALRVAPTVIEFRSIQALVKKSAAGAKSLVEAQTAFDRNASVADVESISGKDLDGNRVGDTLVVTFAYEKKIPLAGPVSLVIDYAGSSNGGS